MDDEAPRNESGVGGGRGDARQSVKKTAMVRCSL